MCQCDVVCTRAVALVVVSLTWSLVSVSVKRDAVECSVVVTGGEVVKLRSVVNHGSGIVVVSR